MEKRKDLETLEVTDWENRVQDRDYWITVTVVVAKILKELLSQERKRKNYLIK
jgi:hypothetical protein